jgi:uncharacterized membrane protein YhaH (DUF805 family)
MTLFSFYGRSNRMDFWLLGFAVGLAQFAILTLFGMVITPLILSTSAAPFQEGVGVGVGLFVLLAHLWPIAALAVRRSHDLNLSGWWYGALVLISGGLDYMARSPINPIALPGIEPMNLQNIMAMATGGVGVVIVIALGFLPGTSAANRFGPPLHGRRQNDRPPISDATDETTIGQVPAAPRQ